MIRDVTVDDACDIATIYNEYVLRSTATFEIEAVGEDEMRRRIADISGCFPYIVHQTGGTVDGYAYAHLWHERAACRRTWETTVYVARDNQHHGIGRQLMERLIGLCREGDCRTLIARITQDNTASFGLHAKLGFRQVGCCEKVGEKMGRLLDLTDWQLTL